MAQQKVEPIAKFKLILFGDDCVEKTTYLKLLKIRGSQEKCVESQLHQLMFYTNKGAIQFICKNTSGEEKFGDLCESFYREAHCAIIMFAGTSRVTYKDVPIWRRDLVRVRGNIPIVLCENKVKTRSTAFLTDTDLQYCGINTESNYNLEKPLLLLARKLVGDPNLKFVKMPPLE